ncbi:MAG: hypothetical protein DI535_21105 [Citrobacter freundii]|nr:MAG: hypothetical protein DI535_21105 [Citrobacter freundii]
MNDKEIFHYQPALTTSASVFKRCVPMMILSRAENDPFSLIYSKNLKVFTYFPQNILSSLTETNADTFCNTGRL